MGLHMLQEKRFGRREAAKLRITHAMPVARLVSGDPSLPSFRLRAAS